MLDNFRRRGAMGRAAHHLCSKPCASVSEERAVFERDSTDRAAALDHVTASDASFFETA
jgi:hypothetical protein